MNTQNAITAFAALAHESRLAVFRLLVRVGPQGLAASKIGEELSIPPSSLSFHLKELAHAGLVKPRPAGRFIIYVAEFDTVNALMGYMSDNCCGGNPCMPVPKCTAAEETAKGT